MSDATPGGPEGVTVRARRAVLVGVLSGCLVFLAACTGGAPESSRPVATSAPALPAGVQISPDPAPSASAMMVAIRADSVRRSGTELSLALTLATGELNRSASVSAPTLAVVSNTGNQVQVHDEQSRQVDQRSIAAMQLDFALPSADTTSVTVGWGELRITVPIPAQDGTTIWNPAPLRQTGLAEPLLLSDITGVVLDAVRTEGMITEVAFHGWSNSLYNTGSPCAFNFDLDHCKLVEPDGTVHTVVGATSQKNPALGRPSGVVRFLGEIKPASKSLQVYLGADQNFDPVTVDLPSHDDSPVEAAAGTLSRTPITLSPAKTVTDKSTGARFSFDRVDVLDDRVQIHFTAKGGTKDFGFDRVTGETVPGLAEPNGVTHRYAPPNGATLMLKPKGRLDVTMVFQGAVAADTTSLELALGGDYTKTLRVKFAIPAADPTPPTPDGTLGQLDPAAQPAVTQPSIGATPSPSTASIASLQVTAAPLSGDTDQGPVRTSIKGASGGAQTADDPTAAEAADRTLQDMGAKRTPDGWVLTLPETVLFDYNSDALRPDAANTLTKVAALLNHFSTAKIAVNGNTDNTGTKEYNADLSTKRATAVANALEGDGVSSARITATGFGETRPVAPNSTDLGKQKNRRVEIVLREAG